VWDARDFASIGIETAFVQDNHVRNWLKGLCAGFIIRCRRWRKASCCVSARVRFSTSPSTSGRGSPTFGHHVAAVLTADNWHQLWVLPGFAHGYCTLEDDTQLQYKATDFRSPVYDRGIAWNDPALMIAWRVTIALRSFLTAIALCRLWPSNRIFSSMLLTSEALELLRARDPDRGRVFTELVRAVLEEEGE
jgi:dTDP-4-dehydrorhamnose 3,5-epimerase